MTITDLLKNLKGELTPEDVFKNHENDPLDNGRDLSTWQLAIFKRIFDKIEGDDEATAMLAHTLDFSSMKARCSGF